MGGNVLNSDEKERQIKMGPEGKSGKTEKW